VPQQEVFAVLSDAYTFASRAGAVVAGRRATVVEALREGRVAKRWWVDDATGVLLWQESYDPNGVAVVSTGFTRVLVDPSFGMISRVPAQTVSAGLTTTAAAGGIDGLTSSGWACFPRMAGLSLLELSTDAAADPRVVHLVYGDGLSTLSVLQQRGLLTEPVPNAVWDGTLGAWRHEGAVTWATWQSGDTVLTVTTDGSAALLADAIGSLPRDKPVSTTTLGRVRDGWSKILADSKG
jgi:negative regulator of sigma E activity